MQARSMQACSSWSVPLAKSPKETIPWNRNYFKSPRVTNAEEFAVGVALFRSFTYLFVAGRSAYFSTEYAVRICGVPRNERQHDRGPDEHEDERARVGRGLPDGEAVDHHIGEQAVGEARERQHEDDHRPGERTDVGFLEPVPDPEPHRDDGERQRRNVEHARE